MSDDLRKRLRRLGVTKGARHLPSVKKPRNPFDAPAQANGIRRATESQSRRVDDGEAPTLAELLPHGRVEAYQASHCFVVEKVYPLHHQHGRYPLGALQEHPLPTAAFFCQDQRLADLSLEHLLFIDTETTGLGGAGTLAFMVGTAYFEREALVVRQFFLRDHADEAALLPLLADMVAQRPGLVTFNGRTFDLPLLDNRYFLNRLTPPHGDLVSQPHIDLLPPSRRIWRTRLTSCSLSSLEQNLLDIRRTQEDVPGWAIPALYNDYLRSGDPRPLRRVFYHNHQDMLSMVTLLTQLLHLFQEPSVGHPLDVVGLAKWHLKLGERNRAEQLLQLARQQSGAGDTAVLAPLAALLKKQDRRTEAVPLWQEMVAYDPVETDALVELAKYYEWHAPRSNDEEAALALAKALKCTDEALNRVEKYLPAHRPLRQELAHRRNRLLGKL